MENLYVKIVPIIALITFGFILRKFDYFEDVAIKRIQNIIINISIPCMLFSSFMDIKIEFHNLSLILLTMLYMGILTAGGFLLNYFVKSKRRFFPLFFGAFGFGTTAMPLFITVFGMENMKAMSLIGVGHELFVGMIYLTLARIYLKQESFSFKSSVKALVSPIFIMSFGALIINLTGMRDLLFGYGIGSGILETIRSLGSLTLTLTLITVGYRLKLDRANTIFESFRLVMLRYLVVFAVGIPFAILVINKIIPFDIMMYYAFFTLIIQHGSLSLTVFVGEYSSTEDHEIINNALVINTIISIIIFIIFVLLI